jgi:kumamolisin
MADRREFPGSIVSLDFGEEGPVIAFAKRSDDDAQTTISINFALKMDETRYAELNERVQAGETISPQELLEKYSGPEKSALALADHLKREGISVDGISSDCLRVFTSGTIEKFETLLAVEFGRVEFGGSTYLMVQDTPSLPEEIACDIHAILGLQPFPAKGHAVRWQPDEEAGGDADAGPEQTYHVDEILSAYSAKDVPNSDGTGEELAVIICNKPRDSDLQAFWTRNGVDCDLSQITYPEVNGGVILDPIDEDALDTEWVTGLVPAANFRFYAFGNRYEEKNGKKVPFQSFADIDTAFSAVLDDLPDHPTLRQVSLSYGSPELQLGKDAIAAASVILFKLFAAGVNVFCSSGDDGNRAGWPTDTRVQVNYPASDRSVIAVGGTTLVLNEQGEIASESGWAGSGGGMSVCNLRSIWQTGGGINPAYVTRFVPDIAATADPNYGALVILDGQDYTVGGTSWAAPVWAAFATKLDQYTRAVNGNPAPSFPKCIYGLMGTRGLHDIVTGNNGYPARLFYDLVTGLGSPSVSDMARLFTTGWEAPGGALLIQNRAWDTVLLDPLDPNSSYVKQAGWGGLSIPGAAMWRYFASDSKGTGQNLWAIVNQYSENQIMAVAQPDDNSYPMPIETYHGEKDGNWSFQTTSQPWQYIMSFPQGGVMNALHKHPYVSSSPAKHPHSDYNYQWDLKEYWDY